MFSNIYSCRHFYYQPYEIDLSISFFARWRKQLARLLPQGSFFNLISAAKGRQWNHVAP